MQRTTTSIALASVLFLSGCGANGGGTNLLLRIQHDEELADTLANVIISKDPSADDASFRTMLQGEIAKAKESLAANQRVQNAGLSGPMLSAKENVQGWVLYMDNTLYTSSDFSSRPGIDLHFYLTTVVDPRDVAFPDVSSMDLGRIDTPYGSMALPVNGKADSMKNTRSLVVWDVKLKRLYGFAQLSARQ